MKIGIISINVHTKSLNFACPLHTYAFQQFLLEHGIEATVIDYAPSYYQKDYDPVHPLNFYMRHGYASIFSEPIPENESPEAQIKRKKKLLTVIKYAALYDIWPKRYQKFQNFINAHYILTEQQYNQENLDVMNPGFDCYICATDVIWQYQADCGFDRGFFLAADTVKEAPKIAYAASRGVYKGWTEEQINQFKEYISSYEAISTREPSFAEHIEELTGKEVPVVLDPVFLKDREFWHNLAIPPKQKNKYVLLYAVMEKAADVAKKAIEFAKRKGLELIVLSAFESNRSLPADADCKILYNIGPEEWLGYMEQAEYIITNSFHACAFSIIFEKEFFVGSRNGDKVTNVLDMFQLQDRRFTQDYDSTLIEKKIDYSSVRQILAEKKKFSCDFILNAIYSVENKYNFKKHMVTRKPFHLIYSSSIKGKRLICRQFLSEVEITVLPGSIEFKPSVEYDGNKVVTLMSKPFVCVGRKFLGWYCHTTFKGIRKWYCTDGQFHIAAEVVYHEKIELYLFRDREETDAFAKNRLFIGDTIVLQAAWKNKKTDQIMPNITAGLNKEAGNYMLLSKK